MYGIIHSELKRYIEIKYGEEVWKKALEDIGLRHKIYLTGGTYPDEEIKKIITAASGRRHSIDSILEDFGLFIAPALMKMYKSLIKPEWRTMELLLNTEGTMHRVVRIRTPKAHPPYLKFEKTGSHTLLLHYDSPRRMAALAKGIMRGVAKHYGEKIRFQEQKKANGSSDIAVYIS